MEIEIKLTGSGDVDDISTHLLQLAQALDPQSGSHYLLDSLNEKGKATWEDPFICAEITEV